MASGNGKPKPKRRYTDEERAAALAALAANGGDVSKTAKQVGVPVATLDNWSRGRRHPEAVQMAEGKKPDLAARLDEIAWQLAESIPDKIPDAPLNQTAVAMGVAIDKARLLRGEPTTIADNRQRVDLSGLTSEELEALERMALKLAGSGGDPG